MKVGLRFLVGAVVRDLVRAIPTFSFFVGLVLLLIGLYVVWGIGSVLIVGGIALMVPALAGPEVEDT